ncbi:hypothetical protein KVF89_01460 [Nocardioides carbamazepini]|uniref:hypothetical protein n=1 Tax=Nocardioides carbamazepini TaxID=2854259 RepID=UPI00214A13CC|nr:hypothetical protein [Nocardioides carbamazepini]MCR1781189.1 hypothetical protein [Nocardioides carbamazepini]
MALFTKSGIAAVAVATGLVLTAGTSGAVAGAMITGKQIKNNTVTTKDIKDGSLGGADIQDGSLTSSDLAAAARGLTGVVVVNASAAVPNGGWNKAVAACPGGTSIVTANAWLASSRAGAQVEITATGATAWSPGLSESGDTLTLRAVCAVLPGA